MLKSVRILEQDHILYPHLHSVLEYHINYTPVNVKVLFSYTVKETKYLISFKVKVQSLVVFNRAFYLT